MKTWDCDVAYGRGALALPREAETAGDLNAELNRFGIEEALVWHRDAFELGHIAGNGRIGELATHPNLHPVMTMCPTCCEDMPAPDEFLRRMQQAGARAVRVFPNVHKFLLDVVSCGDMLDALTGHRIPLIVPLSELPAGWDTVYRLLRDFPDLTLIVTQFSCWGQDRYCRPLMRRYPRFYITMNRLETAGQLKSLFDFGGCEQVLFGSGFPFNNPGGSIMMIARAPIPDSAKEAISWRNLDRLMKETIW